MSLTRYITKNFYNSKLNTFHFKISDPTIKQHDAKLAPIDKPTPQANKRLHPPLTDSRTAFFSNPNRRRGAPCPFGGRARVMADSRRALARAARRVHNARKHGHVLALNTTSAINRDPRWPRCPRRRLGPRESWPRRPPGAQRPQKMVVSR